MSFRTLRLYLGAATTTAILAPSLVLCVLSILGTSHVWRTTGILNLLTVGALALVVRGLAYGDEGIRSPRIVGIAFASWFVGILASSFAFVDRSSDGALAFGLLLLGGAWQPLLAWSFAWPISAATRFAVVFFAMMAQFVFPALMVVHQSSRVQFTISARPWVKGESAVQGRSGTLSLDNARLS